jgi:branched-chain amino acid transport system permease protein
VAITAVAGGLVSIYYPFQPYVGVQFLIIMYAAVVLGGLGSVLGAFWGGLIIGFVQQLSALFLPLELQSAAIFVVLVATLFFKPDGIFGKNVERV